MTCDLFNWAFPSSLGGRTFELSVTFFSLPFFFIFLFFSLILFNCYGNHFLTHVCVYDVTSVSGLTTWLLKMSSMFHFKCQDFASFLPFLLLFFFSWITVCLTLRKNPVHWVNMVKMFSSKRVCEEEELEELTQTFKLISDNCLSQYYQWDTVLSYFFVNILNYIL